MCPESTRPKARSRKQAKRNPIKLKESKASLVNHNVRIEVRETSGGYQSRRKDAPQLKPTPVIGVDFPSQNELIREIRLGFEFATIELLTESLEVKLDEVAHLVGIPSRTLSRRKKSGHLLADESERVYRVGTLVDRAIEVLEDKDDAIQWLKTPKKALGGQTPLEYADTEVGIHEVKDLLGRIEEGIFS